MSRSNYTDDDDEGRANLWRGTVARAIRGKRGQAFLRDLLAALDAMSVKRLITDELAVDELVEEGEVIEEGGVCAIGSVGKARGVDMSKLDPEDPYAVAKAFGVASALVQEIEWHNDEAGDRWNSTEKRIIAETPEERWTRMRAWVAKQIREGSVPHGH